MLLFSSVFYLSAGIGMAQENVDGYQQQNNPYTQNTVQRGAEAQSTSTAQNAQVGIQAKNVLPFYGYDFFDQRPEQSFSSISTMPAYYTLGPGDRIGIYLTGKVQEEFDVIVNVEGKVYVPTVGVFPISGLTLAEFQKLLTEKLSKFYDNYHVELMLLQPKQVQVTVVGEVNKPGRYTLFALNTVFDALSMAGGPKTGGSLRNINVYRNDSLLAIIDLYQFLMQETSPREILLNSGDRIFVPLLMETITVTGEIKRPGVYELSNHADETLIDAVDLSGGFTDYAFLDRVEISRLQGDGSRRVMYINMQDHISAAESIVLKNEDKIRVYSKLSQITKRVVTIHGEVDSPGEYELEDNMYVSDLILRAGSLTRSAYLVEAEVAKVDPKMPAHIIKIDLTKLLIEKDKNVDILLEEDDQVFIRQIPEWEVGPKVEVRGEVMFPGFYPIVKDSTYLSDIMQKCGGFTDKALIREARLVRRSSKITVDKEYESLKTLSREDMSETEYEYLVMKENTRDIGEIVVDFHKLVFAKDADEDVILENGDIIQVPKAPIVVGVTGRVSRAGGVTYKSNADIEYYVDKAGGYAWDANARKTKVIKVTGEILDDEDVKELVPGDIIYVPRKHDRDYWELFRQFMLVAAQTATIILVIQNAMNN